MSDEYQYSQHSQNLYQLLNQVVLHKRKSFEDHHAVAWWYLTECQVCVASSNTSSLTSLRQPAVLYTYVSVYPHARALSLVKGQSQCSHAFAIRAFMPRMYAYNVHKLGGRGGVHGPPGPSYIRPCLHKLGSTSKWLLSHTDTKANTQCTQLKGMLPYERLKLI